MEEHIPVLIEEILRIMNSHHHSGICIDATLGHGGYSAAILAAFPDIRVIGLDRDQESIELSNERLSKYKDRFFAIHCNYSDIKTIINSLSYEDKIQAIIYDLGVSTLQITSPQRGFSFQENGPLDMRMDATKENAVTAFQIINFWTEQKLRDLFFLYGEERYSKYIAKAIIQYREKYGNISCTEELVGIIRRVLPQPVQRKMGGHPARRVFQSLRIAVNNELESLKESILDAHNVIDDDGLIFVVSYHSLEDKIVKQLFNKFINDKSGYLYNKKVIKPSSEEIDNNYRSRSAKMRVFIKYNKILTTKEKSRWTDPLSL